MRADRGAHSLFLLLKTDTDRACSMSLSLMSSLCRPLRQKSRATSVILSAPALLQDVPAGRVTALLTHSEEGPHACGLRPPGVLPEEYEDGLLIGDLVHHVVVVQEGLDGVDEAGVHLVHLIEYEDGPGTGTHVAPDPLL